MTEPKSMAIFGHPNHELALYGLMQRWKPAVIFLTDGGGLYRVDDSIKGLKAIEHHGPFEILPFKEDDLYRAFLGHDVDFFRGIVVMLRERIKRWGPERILCDAVEFFNPIHDIVRPLVDAALVGQKPVELLEVPITYQRSREGAFEFQRPMDSRKLDEIRFTLTADEYSQKLLAWEHVYQGLRQLIGPLVGDRARFRFETLVKGRRGIPHPNGECTLRYEQRGEDLRQAGKVETVITHGEHYDPMVKALL